MAAAAAVELAGGQPQQAAAAVSMALMNLMGLVCDPVGGLVEVPCVYRNVAGRRWPSPPPIWPWPA